MLPSKEAFFMDSRSNFLMQTIENTVKQQLLQKRQRRKYGLVSLELDFKGYAQKESLCGTITSSAMSYIKNYAVVIKNGTDKLLCLSVVISPKAF